MNALVVTFSQTGNTAAVARAIGRGLEAGGASADVRPIEEVDPGEWTEADLLAVGAPVFYYREPVNVADWIRRLPHRDGPVPVLTFNTNGGNPTNTFRRLARALRRKGGRVVGSYACPGFDTYGVYLGTLRKWGHPSEEDLAAAETFGRDAVAKAERVLAGEPVPEPRYPFVGGKTFRLSLLLRGPVMKWVLPKLWLDEAACIRCGLCAARCPTDNIRLAPAPVFADRCMYCYLCEKVCPRSAIVCDWRDLRKRMHAD